jgi:hypothetical protein
VSAEKLSGTYGSLHDPDFAFEQRDDTHNNLHSIAKSRVQQPGKSLSERQGHLFCGIAKQLRRDPIKSRDEDLFRAVRTLARGMIATKLNPNRSGASQFR